MSMKTKIKCKGDPLIQGKKGVSTQGGNGRFDPERVMVLSIGPGSGHEQPSIQGRGFPFDPGKNAFFDPAC